EIIEQVPAGIGLQARAQDVGGAVEDQATRLSFLDPVRQDREKLRAANMGRRQIEEIHEPFGDGFSQRQAERGGVGQELLRSFFKRGVESGLPLGGALEDELKGEEALADARAAGDQGHAPRKEPAAEELIEL